MVRDRERAEAWVEAAVVKVEDLVASAEVAAKGEEVALRQARAGIASAPSVVKEQPINWDAPVMSSNVLSAERP